MKLIKEGRKPVFAKLFECPDCHSIFEAERGEYTTRTEDFMGTEYHAVCPFCGRNGYMIIRSWEYLKGVSADEESGQAETHGAV